MNLTSEKLKEFLGYDHVTGLFTWIKTTNRSIKVGTIAGCMDNNGYICIGLLGVMHRAHRLAWLYMTNEWPLEVDHENGKEDDNRWLNLCEKTHQENLKNRKLNSNNVTGCMGVYWDKERSKYIATIKDNGKKVWLGRHSTIFDAACVRKSAEIRFGYHRNHGRVL